MHGQKDTLCKSVTMGSAKMIFLGTLINVEQDEKNFQNQICHLKSFKIRFFQFMAMQTEAREQIIDNDVKGRTQANWPQSFSVVYKN